MIITHATCMFAGFFSMTAGITTALFMRGKRWWLRVHRRLGTVAIVCILLGFIVAVFTVSQLTGRHFAVPHAWLGIITILSALGTYTAGLMQFRIKTAWMRSLHRWAGRWTFALMILNIVSGLSLTGIL